MKILRKCGKEIFLHIILITNQCKSNQMQNHAKLTIITCVTNYAYITNFCSCHILRSHKKWYLSSEYTFWCIVNELKPLLKEKSEFRGILQTEFQMTLISKTLIIEIIFHRYWNDRSYHIILESIYAKYRQLKNQIHFRLKEWMRDV